MEDLTQPQVDKMPKGTTEGMATPEVLPIEGPKEVLTVVMEKGKLEDQAQGRTLLITFSNLGSFLPGMLDNFIPVPVAVAAVAVVAAECWWMERDQLGQVCIKEVAMVGEAVGTVAILMVSQVSFS